MIEKINHYSVENPGTVYDEEAMTALELAGRLAAKMNEAISAYNDLEKDTTDTLKAQNDFIRLMNDETLPANVRAEVQRHIQNGDFDDAIDLYAGGLQAQLTHLLANVPTGSTTMDAEIIDARLGENGVSYDTLGLALREQIKLVSKRARCLWVNSATADSKMVQVNTTANTITLATGFYIGTYNRISLSAEAVLSYDPATITSETYALAIDITTKEPYMVQMFQNFHKHQDILLCWLVFSNGKLNRVFSMATVAQNIYVDGKSIDQTRGEVIDARTGEDGKKYDTAGIAIREQIKTSQRRTRNLWINFKKTAEPVVLIDTENSTVTLKAGFYIGIYYWKTLSSEVTINIDWTAIGNTTSLLVLDVVTGEPYFAAYTANLHQHHDVVIGYIYCNSTPAFGRFWAYPGVEKNITVDGVYLNGDDPTVTECNRHTANIFRKVVCVGDSLTSGHMSELNADGSYTTHVAMKEYAWPRFMEKLTGSSWVNCGVSGATVLTWQTATGGLAAARTAGAAQAYVIRFMGNDISKGLPVGTTADLVVDGVQTFLGGYGQIIRTLRGISPKAKIFVCTDPNVSGNYPAFNAAVRAIAEYWPEFVFCVDLLKYHELFAMASFTGDALKGHYTATGYEQMAEIYHKLISEIINKNPKSFQDVPFIEYT